MDQSNGITANLLPRGSIDPMQVYSPGRDLANCGGGLLKMAIRTLKPKDRPAWFTAAMTEMNLSEEDLGRAALTLAEGLHIAAEDPDCPDTGAGLERTGFFETPRGAQLLIMARFGQLCAALAVSGIRSVTYDGVPPPQLAHVAAAIEEARTHLPWVEPRS